MISRQLSTTVILSTVLGSACAFTASARPKVLNPVPTSALSVGFAPSMPRGEDEAAYLMNQARACANSDECSLEEAQTYLINVLQVQSGCAAGVLNGSDICDNQDTAAEVVANLRAKVEQGVGYRKESTVMSALQMGLLSTATFVAVAAAFVTANLSPDTVPFTAQEWWWAVRDGYLPSMLSHYYHHGGLATDEFALRAAAVTGQEWSWAVRDGYLPTLLRQTFMTGGLSTDGATETSPFTLQEVAWAVKRGYLNTMIDHAIGHAGLSTGEYTADVSALTPEEWVNAARGGYLDIMVNHFYKNGGL